MESAVLESRSRNNSKPSRGSNDHAAPKRFEALQSSKTCNATLILRDQEPDVCQECFDVRHLLGDNAAELGSGDLAIARIAAVRCNRSGVATACYLQSDALAATSVNGLLRLWSHLHSNPRIALRNRIPRSPACAQRVVLSQIRHGIKASAGRCTSSGGAVARYHPLCRPKHAHSRLNLAKATHGRCQRPNRAACCGSAAAPSLD